MNGQVVVSSGTIPQCTTDDYPAATAAFRGHTWLKYVNLTDPGARLSAWQIQSWEKRLAELQRHAGSAGITERDKAQIQKKVQTLENQLNRVRGQEGHSSWAEVPCGFMLWGGGCEPGLLGSIVVLGGKWGLIGSRGGGGGAGSQDTWVLFQLWEVVFGMMVRAGGGLEPGLLGSLPALAEEQG